MRPTRASFSQYPNHRKTHTHTWKHIGILWHFWGLILSPNSGLTFCGLGLKNKAKKGCQKCDPKMGFKLFPFDGQKWEAKKGLIIYGKQIARISALWSPKRGRKSGTQKYHSFHINLLSCAFFSVRAWIVAHVRLTSMCLLTTDIQMASVV